MVFSKCNLKILFIFLFVLGVITEILAWEMGRITTAQVQPGHQAGPSWAVCLCKEIV